MVNKVILIGRLGADPEVRYTQDGTQITNFRIATSEYWKEKDGTKAERTEWHRIVTFGKIAEFCGSYLMKGRMVYCEGRIQTREWEDKEGHKRSTTEIVASNVQALEKKASNERRVGDDDQMVGGATDTQDDVPF
ncbi:MAG: single-stranded DNA-binding protein [Deltaproteobacteria bacterium]|nr:single-stranded DNA-binding protein [Deltaproteobacteria bacterium]